MLKRMNMARDQFSFFRNENTFHAKNTPSYQIINCKFQIFYKNIKFPIAICFYRSFVVLRRKERKSNFFCKLILSSSINLSITFNFFIYHYKSYRENTKKINSHFLKWIISKLTISKMNFNKRKVSI